MKLLGLLALVSGMAFGAAQPDLIGGRPARAGEFPEVLYIRIGGSTRCSATVIGPEVILTAAHCVPDNGAIDPVSELPSFEVAGVQYHARCKQAPLYRDHRADHDMALCKVDRRLPIRPARVAVDAVRLDEQVFLTGYGCTRPGGGAGNDGILRVGKAKVVQLPNIAHGDYWFYTRDVAALCFGDSGSSAQRVVAQGEQHEVVGVNSRGNIEDLSLLTAIYSLPSQEFMVAFARAEGVVIAGLNDANQQ